jgi:hypothetical protein
VLLNRFVITWRSNLCWLGRVASSEPSSILSGQVPALGEAVIFFYGGRVGCRRAVSQLMGLPFPYTSRISTQEGREGHMH